MGKINQYSKKIVVILILFYQRLISPIIGNHCRFYPSCSNYAVEAINRHGIIHGCFYTMTRLCRCHPWHKGGVDLVPD